MKLFGEMMRKIQSYFFNKFFTTRKKSISLKISDYIATLKKERRTDDVKLTAAIKFQKLYSDSNLESSGSIEFKPKEFLALTEQHFLGGDSRLRAIVRQTIENDENLRLLTYFQVDAKAGKTIKLSVSASASDPKLKIIGYVSYRVVKSIYSSYSFFGVVAKGDIFKDSPEDLKKSTFNWAKKIDNYKKYGIPQECNNDSSWEGIAVDNVKRRMHSRTRTIGGRQNDTGASADTLKTIKLLEEFTIKPR
ncbi:MAG: hypothetical protein ACD_46C00171G0001 [uncultured bacterium]|nr:MAG: hypothetical protein ACD_46C00171G0001 [uncultured bacterium]